MVVMWATNGTCSIHVEFGTAPWNLEESATGASATFTEHNTQGLQSLHRVKLKQSLTDVLFTGDLSLHSELISIVQKKVLSGQFSVVLSAGTFASDMSAANGVAGDDYMAALQPAAALIPYLTAPGENDVEGGQYSHYRHRFAMPGAPWPMDANNLWYSFHLGPVHFVSYSTEVFLESGDSRAKTQKDWLTNDLTQANKERDKRPWIVAFGYRPMYCTSPEHHECATNSSRVRAGLEDLFYYYGVDIVLQFHEDNYERLLPTLRGVVLATNYTNPRAPTQIVYSSSGSKEAIVEPSANSTTTPPWSALRITNGTQPAYGQLRIINASHAHWEFRSGTDDSLLDSLWIVQENHGKFQLEDLPSDLGKAIDHTLEASGGKPGHLNVRDPEKEHEASESFAQTDQTRRLIIGASFGGFVLFLLIIVLVVKLRKRTRRVTRRWDSVDFKYGKTKLYAPANDDLDDDKEEDNDFEADIPDGTLQTAKLINGK
ncbi:hypothetical protein C0Q70_19211 [Pomacea canaliculata]|uniref:Acid phosphatase n=1 Tax=Pomacea canaliculata TaxID=400727 RepID=A0A2T7NIR3_POMCA|nr:hypothetical protein C0Q70_19211 [Pomacea canaliculata]